ncbi:MAG: ATP-binding protein [Luteibacter sp.]|uniref:ATP-binding protein n=1 Tax=Luteibacter sp. TaxID=1886636 RepID=UPI0028071282|nr:ATP-binding protein [Luteibacter sp.]MDQ7995584.1 ATP-binding protein [Luteibacter sp.]MDQ8047672.1 ATP-binding protein [Luteibacter sp.]
MQSQIATAPALDLSNCADEPIRTPGAVQPYGVVLVIDPETLTVSECAVADARIVEAFGEPLGAALDSVLGGHLSGWSESITALDVGTSSYLGMVALGSHGQHHALAHRTDADLLIVELEQSLPGESGSLEALYPVIRRFMSEIEQASSIGKLCELGAQYVRQLTHFDRTLVYRFDEEWNGSVIAEERNDVLPSYMDLRFPESDIPAQARELYRRNRVRLIADNNYRSTPLVRAPQYRAAPPTDLSPCVLRSVSPMHLEYMRNMGTGASMSISLLHDSHLWGLISCHNEATKRVPYHVRTACELIGQILSLQIAEKERVGNVEERAMRRASQMHLLGRMSGEQDFILALKRDQKSFLAVTGASGAAIVQNDECILIGECPTDEEVRALIPWLTERRGNDDVFSTDRLPTEWPAAEAYAERASGVLAITISQLHDSYLIWFRPEVIRTVRWGGEPRKVISGEKISPRLSFEAWKETVRLRSLPWTDVDRDAAMDLRVAIVDIVLRKAEEMALLNEKLTRSNKELEAFSYSVSHDLRAPFRHIVGYSELLASAANDRLDDTERRFLDTIVDSAKSAGRLVDDLLSFSQLGRSTMGTMTINMGTLVEDVRERLEMEALGRNIRWTIATLPSVKADPAMLRLVWQNLISNALKFTRDSPEPAIEVGHERGDEESIFFVRDNGCGFDMRYVDKLFGVFQRLHHVEEYEGTGIGLAHVRRIVSRHGGRTWAESVLGQGATIYFSIPDSVRGHS